MGRHTDEGETVMHCMRNSLACAMVSCGLLLAGCVSQRIDAYAYAKGGEADIRTRYRYRVVGYKWKCPEQYRQLISENSLNEFGRKYETDFLGQYPSTFCASFPNVFSESRGIPIVLKEISSTDNYDGPPTIALSICSLHVFPNWMLRSGETTFAIHVANSNNSIGNSIGNTKIGWCNREAVSTIIPPSLLFDPEPAKCAIEAGYFVSASLTNSVFSNRILPSGFCGINKVTAYAVALKLKELEASGMIDSILQAHRRQIIVQQTAAQTVQTMSTHCPQKPPYKIISLCRDASCDFAYAFVLELNGEPSIQTFFGIQGIFAHEVRNAYKMEYPNADVSTLRIAVQPQQVSGRIQGRAAVLTIVPVSLSYDANTRQGRLSVRFNVGQMEEARAWIRKNIETLARDKNIALVAGQLPPAATYYSLGEKIDGDVMEIELKTK